MPLTPQQVAQYNDVGYVVEPGLFEVDTARLMMEHYMRMRVEGPKPGDHAGLKEHPEDSNHQYPRMINMQNWDEQTEQWSRSASMLESVAQLIEDEPVLEQTMLYFKPPGGYGQALHQDQQYIPIEPLIGVWVSLDLSDEAVGQMVVVPGSHKLGLLEVEAADTTVSFTKVQTVMPAGSHGLGLDMQPGDTLYFHGKTIHGSSNNLTADRWRRSFICHFVGAHAARFEPPAGKHVTHLSDSG